MGDENNKEIELTDEQKEAIKELTQSLVDGRVKSYRKKINDALKSNKEFVYENTAQGVTIKPQIMYKLKNDDGKTFLEGPEGRKYEFLIETDKDDFAYGIYFGCKCILNTKLDVCTQVEKCNKEWEYIANDITKALNNVFENLDFSERAIPTDNASRMTYWPRWYRLGEDESVEDVAVVATKIIRNIYRDFLFSEKYADFLAGKATSEEKQRGPKRLPRVVTRYTQACYDDTIQSFGDAEKYHDDAPKRFEEFIELLMEEDIISPHPIYEKCWTIKWQQNHFAYLYSEFYNAQLKKHGNYARIEWQYIVRNFIAEDGYHIGDIKKDFNALKRNNDITSSPKYWKSFPEDQLDKYNRVIRVIREWKLIDV